MSTRQMRPNQAFAEEMAAMDEKTSALYTVLKETGNNGLANQLRGAVRARTFHFETWTANNIGDPKNDSMDPVYRASAQRIMDLTRARMTGMDSTEPPPPHPDEDVNAPPVVPTVVVDQPPPAPPATVLPESETSTDEDEGDDL